jgi:hypothetical protein
MIKLASAHRAAMAPTAIITRLRATGGRARSPSVGEGGGRTRATAVPTAKAPPRASTNQASRFSPKKSCATTIGATLPDGRSTAALEATGEGANDYGG